MPKQVVDLMACWIRRVGQDDIDIVWDVIPSFLMWCILRETNALSFNDGKRTSSDL
jgi:hypothetical protein